MFLANKQQPYLKLLADSFRSFKPLFSKLLPVYIFQCLALFGLSYLANRFIFNDEWISITREWGSVSSGSSEPIEQFTFISGFFNHIREKAALGIAYGLTIGLISFYSLIVLFHRGDGVLNDDKAKISQSWIAGLKRLLPTLGYTLVTFILVIAIYLVLAVIGLIVYATLKDMASAAFSILVGMTYLWFYIRFVLYTQVLIMTRKGPVFKSIGTGLSLSSGYFWRLLGMLTLVVGLPFLILLGIELYMVIPMINSLSAGMFNIILSLFNGIITIIVTTLFIGGTYVFLNDSAHHQNMTVE